MEAPTTRSEFVDRVEGVDRLDGYQVTLTKNEAGGQIYVVFAEDGRYARQGDTCLLHAIGVDRHADLAVGLAGHLDLVYSLNVRQRRDDLGLDQLGNGFGTCVGDYAELEDRKLIGVETAYIRPVNAIRKGQASDRGLH